MNGRAKYQNSKRLKKHSDGKKTDKKAKIEKLN